MGPTAVGKTELALALAERFPLGLISVDSAMVYRHLDIGTGKPGRAVRARHPHRLIDIREPWEQYTAGEFASDALLALKDIQASGRVPLLVGGTLLYFRSLMQGLAPLPPADLGVRTALDDRAEQEGWPALHGELARLDPVAAARIGRRDRQRIQRALEVWQLTGQRLSELQKQPSPAAGAPAKFMTIGLVPTDRSRLTARITQRFQAMLAGGFLGEVEALLAMPGMHPDAPSLRAVGYRQLGAFLGGVGTLAEAEDRALAATRQLAKRQLTWLRRESFDATLAMESPRLLEEILVFIESAIPSV